MTTLLERGRRGESLADVGLIDVHVHLGRCDFTVPAHDARQLVAVMNRVGVESVLASHIRCLCGQPELGNDEVLGAMRACPGRILGYVILLPRSADWVRAEMQRRIDAGFSGLKLHNSNSIPYTEPAYEPAFELADQHRMPVLLHTWGGADEFQQVRTLAAEFPNASFLLAHSGAENVDGYVKIARELPNVYLDTCMSRGPRGLVEHLVRAVGTDKVVWGSDGGFINMAHQLGKILGARLSDDDKRKIMSDNARRILGRIQR